MLHHTEPIRRGGRCWEPNVVWCMVDALLKQGGDLGVPDAKSGVGGVRKNLTFGSEKWEGS